MFCPNCRNSLNGSEDFCPNCGTQTMSQQKQMSNDQMKADFHSAMTISDKKLKFPIFRKIGHFKKKILFGISCLFLVITGIFLYNKFVGFESLAWDNSYLDDKTEYVTQTKLKLGIKFSNKKKASEIQYKTTCGKITGKGLEIIWELLDVTGKCEITASYKQKKIKKVLNVLPFDFNEGDLTLEYKIDEDSDEDLDYDGLTNKQEKQYKTNPTVADSDLDGLDDYYEIFTSKTNPNKKDSDNDGLNDYDEIVLGLDPNKADSKNDGIKDGQRVLTYDYTSDQLKLSVTGKGNIASTNVAVNPNTKISHKTGLIDNLFTFYTDGTVSEATIVITYTEEELEKYHLNEENLSIFYYNEKESKYEKVDTTIDKKNKTLTATLKHFSNYVVGDSLLVKNTTPNQILFILDNSWSMYTDEQYREITGNNDIGGIFGSSELNGFDSEGLRFTLTSDLISKLANKNSRIGLSEFRTDYANILKIGSDTTALTQKLKNMNGNFATLFAGTNISNALTSGISEFDEESSNKYIVILTDGEDYSLQHNAKRIIEKAILSDVKICSIGFGDGLHNTELSNVSNATGCKFFSSSNVNGLTELFENVEAELTDNLVDVDGDNEIDGILIADSGFIVNRDGFSFANYGTNLSPGGHCYGMATFAQLYYKKVLPLHLGAKTAMKETSYAYNLSNTYFKDYANLYDYKLKTNSLKYEFGFSVFEEAPPSDFRALNGTVYALNDPYKKEIIDSGIYDIVEIKSSLTPEEQLEKYGVVFESGESYYINEDKIQTNTNFMNDDKQLFNAIYTGHIRQNVTTHYSSGSNFVLWLRNVFGTEITDYKGAIGFITILKTRLEDKDAPIIYSSFNGGLHAINAISLIQDIENPNYYYIGVYDNNYPGEKRYVDVECTKTTCVTKANEYYENSGQPIRITPSLEYDLEYYRSK